MGRNRGGRLAILVFGVALLLRAGPLCGSALGAGWDGSGTSYSPWTYRTPYLYRLCEWVHDCKAGGHGAECYPTGPWGIQVTTSYPYPPYRKCCPAAPGQPPPDQSPEAAGK